MKTKQPLPIKTCSVLNSSLITSILSKIQEKKEINGTVRTHYSSLINIYYWSVYENKKIFLMVSQNGNQPQRILLSNLKLKNPLFQCGCGQKVESLYLPQKEKEFKCFDCYGLNNKVSNFEPLLKKVWFIVDRRYDGKDHSKEIIDGIKAKYGKQ